MTILSAFFDGTLTVLKPFGLSVPPGALTATAGTPGTKCLPFFPSNEPLPSLNALYVSVTKSRRAYVSSLTADTPLSAVWRKVYKLSGKHPPVNAPVLKVHNTAIADPLKVANTLDSHFSQISSGSHLVPQFHILKSAKECTPITFSLSSETHYNSPFTFSELTSALHSCHNTREGPDHIHYLMLKHLPPSSLTFLLAHFNHVWTKGDFPPSWREALILPFVKSSKPGSLPNDYHLIALTSRLCKLLE